MNKNTSVMFLRDENRKPVGCVAMQLSRNGKSIRYQFSTWNPVDKFDRALARQLALGRLLDKPLTLKATSPLKGRHAATALVMTQLVNDQSVPTRSKEAALRWLDEALKRTVDNMF